jgi:hypothetical protein
VSAWSARCRAERMELPTPGQVDRLVGSAVRSFDEQFCAATVGRLSATTTGLLEKLVAEPGPEGKGTLGGGRAFFNELKQDPGAPGLESLLPKLGKLEDPSHLDEVKAEVKRR